MEVWPGRTVIISKIIVACVNQLHNVRFLSYCQPSMYSPVPHNNLSDQLQGERDAGILCPRGFQNGFGERFYETQFGMGLARRRVIRVGKNLQIRVGTPAQRAA
jgi:hypothetical protein